MLSFIYLGIYWNNHHLLHAARQVDVAVAILWLVPDRRIERALAERKD